MSQQDTKLRPFRLAQAEVIENRCSHIYASTPDFDGPDMCDINDKICLLERDNPCDICVEIMKERKANDDENV